jgi:hypothetical protein
MRSAGPANHRSWRNRRLQLKPALSRLSPVQRADLKGQQRVETLRSLLPSGKVAPGYQADFRHEIANSISRFGASARCSVFKSPGSAQHFLSVHAAVDNNFNLQRHLISRSTLRILREEAFRTRQAVTAAWPESRGFLSTWKPRRFAGIADSNLRPPRCGIRARLTVAALRMAMVFLRSYASTGADAIDRTP